MLPPIKIIALKPAGVLRPSSPPARRVAWQALAEDWQALVQAVHASTWQDAAEQVPLQRRPEEPRVHLPYHTQDSTVVLRNDVWLWLVKTQEHVNGTMHCRR